MEHNKVCVLSLLIFNLRDKKLNIFPGISHQFQRSFVFDIFQWSSVDGHDSVTFLERSLHTIGTPQVVKIVDINSRRKAGDLQAQTALKIFADRHGDNLPFGHSFVGLHVVKAFD